VRPVQEKTRQSGCFLHRLSGNTIEQDTKSKQCDEKQPCTSCQRHHVQCSLVQRLPQRATGGSNTSSPTNESDGVARADDDTWIADLELMHHYATITYATIPTPSHTEHVLQANIPRLGIRFPYLMHQLLAVSSLHIAYLSPEPQTAKKYLVSASYHQSIAIGGIRTTLSKPIAEGTSHALFVASAFLMVGTFATNRVSDSGHCPMDGILETFSVVRGVRGIREATSKELRQNLVGDLFGAQPLNTTGESLRLVEGQLFSLKAKIIATADEGEELKFALCSGIDLLRAFTDKMSTVMARKELSVVFGWPWTISEELLEFLRARHPAALTVFLYYCIILQTLEAEYWFLEGWSAKLGTVIAASLRGSQWEEVAMAPLRQLKVPGK
jgi:hypothetical protein